MKTYTLRNGDVVTSKDGKWSTMYTNLTQARNAAAKIAGAEVIQCGRPFYVRLRCPCGCGSAQHHQEDVEVAR